jgi:hypothetical protein
MVGGETAQELGREGVHRAKRWLESTTRFVVEATTLDLPGAEPFLFIPQAGSANRVRMDMTGRHLDEEGGLLAQFYAEVKNVTTDSGLSAEYKKFLAKAYSSERSWESIGNLRPIEWMFITWHPFGATGNYTSLTGVEAIKAACDAHPDRVPPSDWDEGKGEDLSRRLWVLIPSQRLEEMLPAKRTVVRMLNELSLSE